MVEFDSSVYSGEAPPDGGPVLVALPLQGLDVLSQGLLIGDAAMQDAPPKYTEHDFCHPLRKLRTGFSQLPYLGV